MLHLRFWDLPLLPSPILQGLTHLLPASEKVGIVLDFGSSFPWSNDARLSREPFYPQVFVHELAKRLRGRTLYWYVPLHHGPWHGDLPCYDGTLAENCGCGTRFLQEMLADVEGLGFEIESLVFDTTNISGATEIAEKACSLLDAARETGLRATVYPVDAELKSVYAALRPEGAAELSRLEDMVCGTRFELVRLLDGIGRLFQGSVRGYWEGNRIQRDIVTLEKDRSLLRAAWDAWIDNERGHLMPGAAVQYADASMYALEAIWDLFEQRMREYERFRKAIPNLVY